MGQALRSLFNLYPGESKKVGLFALLALVWSSGSYGLLTLSGGLFVEHVGARGLPEAYVAIAICMCLISSFLVWSIPKLSLKYLLSSILGLSLIMNALCFLGIDTASFWYFFKISNWILPIVIYSVFWGFVDQYYDLQDGKRCFCLFNAIIFLGDALGAAFVSFSLETIGVCSVVAICLGLVGCSIPLIGLIGKKIEPIPEETTKTPVQKTSFKKLIALVFSSRFTIALLLFYLAMHLITIITEYHYTESFERILSEQGRLDHITEFIGRSNMGISLGNMLFGVFFYSRLVKRVGIHNTIMITPLVFLILYSIFGLWTSLTCAILAMIACEGFAYALDDNNLNLLLSGVCSKAKNQIRIAVDSFFEPIGMLISALLLLFFRQQHLKIGLGLCACAVLLGFVLRASYHSAIFQNLLASTMRFQNKALRWFETFSSGEQKYVEHVLLGHLKTSNEKTQLMAYQTLLELNNPKILPYLLDRFGKMSIPGKIAAIGLFEKSSFEKEPIILDTLKRWVKKLPHPSLKASIHFYLAKQNHLSEKQSLDHLQHPDLEIRGAGIVALCFSEHLELQNRAKLEIKKLFDSKEEKKILLGLKIIGIQRHQENIPLLLPFLKNDSETIALASALAIDESSQYCDAHLAGEIISRLQFITHKETRFHCFKALETLSESAQVLDLMRLNHKVFTQEWKTIESIALRHGDKMTKELQEILVNTSYHIQSRVIAAKALAKHLSHKRFLMIAEGVLDQAIDKAFFYFYHSHEIQKQIPECHLWVLEKLLLSKHELTLDFIIQMIALIGKIKYPEVLSISLASPQKKIQAQAYETLEKSCPAKLLKKLQPLINDQSKEVKLRAYLKNGRMPWNVWQVLDYLERSSFYEDRVVASSLKEQFDPIQKVETEKTNV